MLVTKVGINYELKDLFYFLIIDIFVLTRQ